MRKIVPKDIISIMKEMNLNINVEELIYDEELSSQGVDSLDMMSLYFNLEEKIPVKISNEYFSDKQWDTIDNIVANVNNLLEN